MFIQYLFLFFMFHKYSSAHWCPDGKYGANCSLPCSVNCAGVNNSCRRADGSCYNGCDPGYRGKQCNEVGCSHGWFGKSCQFLCHCVGNTSCSRFTGHCEKGCELGWIGPGCQYVNLKFKPDKYRQKWISDNDDSTCNDRPDTQGILKFKPFFPITWVRIVHIEAEGAEDIDLSYQSSKFVEHGKRCLQYGKVRVNERTLDFSCFTNEVVRYLYVTGPGFQFVCSIYVSGGRNLALKQPTQQSSWKDRGKLAVDGDDGTNTSKRMEETCTYTDKGENQYWEVHFSHPMDINAIIIYNRPDCCQYYMDYFELLVLDAKSKTLFKYYDRYGNSQKVYTIVPEYRMPRNIAKIRIKKDPISYALRICEVVVLGDLVCPPGRYGRECELECNCLAGKDCLVSTGGCPSGCMYGYTGKACLTQCPKKTWGLACAHQCPDSCINQTCDFETGVCLTCPLGYSLPYCKIEKVFSKPKGHLYLITAVIATLVTSAVAFFFCTRNIRQDGSETAPLQPTTSNVSVSETARGTIQDRRSGSKTALMPPAKLSGGLVAQTTSGTIQDRRSGSKTASMQPAISNFSQPQT